MHIKRDAFQVSNSIPFEINTFRTQYLSNTIPFELNTFQTQYLSNSTACCLKAFFKRSLRWVTNKVFMSMNQFKLVDLSLLIAFPLRIYWLDKSLLLVLLTRSERKNKILNFINWLKKFRPLAYAIIFLVKARSISPNVVPIFIFWPLGSLNNLENNYIQSIFKLH